jgi:uncharacterized protein DUF4136
MKKVKSIWLLPLLFLFAACGITSEVQKDPAVDLNSYKTYSWLQKDSAKSYKDFQESYLISRVSEELDKRGWKKVDAADNPDALIDYDIMIGNELRNESEPVYSRPLVRYLYNPVTRRVTTVWYPSQYLGERTYSVPYKSGTVTVNIVDNESNKLVWQAWSETEVSNARLDNESIDKIVKSMFKKFNK